MAHTIPSTEPETVIAGDRIQWTLDLADYKPADGWTLKYTLINADADAITITASDNGDGTHLVDIDTTTSASWTPGEYHWQAFVDDFAGSRYTVRTGRLEILKKFEGVSGGYDARTHVKKTLDALEAVIEGKASSDQLNYSIAGRSLTHYSPEELLRWRNYYRNEYRAIVAQERIDKGKASGRQIHVRLQ